MLEGARGVVVAVSGGADSVALVDLLSRIVESDGKSEIKLRVAHLNHQLRGNESTEDAEFVRILAEKLNLPCSIDSRDIRQIAESLGRGIEETAREVRYNFLIATARHAGFDIIATGHTMTDQAETFLMRLARGAGLRGLAAMRAVTDAPYFPRAESLSPSPLLPLPHSSALLIRPMLGITREEVEEYCCERKISYRTDSSNLEINYSRNRVRHRLLPAMRELNLRAVEAIARTAEIVASEQDALSGVVESLMREAELDNKCDDNRASYSIAALHTQGAALRRRIIIEALRKVRLDNNKEISEIELRHIEEVEHLLKEGRSGSRINLPGGVEVWREFDSLVFLHSPVEIENYEFEINSKNFRVEAGGLRIELVRGQKADLLNNFVEAAKKERRAGKRDWMKVALDDERLDQKLVVRTRREGERVDVSGHGKTKKLKKLMIGHRIAPSRRKLWPVVATLDGQYVWSPGLPPASTFAPHNESRRLAILQASEI
jgi:tRNA(Ile)-lysidine synthase